MRWGGQYRLRIVGHQQPGTVHPQMVAAALDCPGAFAFIVDGEPAGLLGRIVLEQYRPAPAVPHVVTGWRIGTEGRKLFAGTPIVSADGMLLAAARATWFPFGSHPELADNLRATVATGNRCRYQPLEDPVWHL